ncbi:hypothetical protein D3C78_1172920 [compost metagenome]
MTTEGMYVIHPPQAHRECQPQRHPDEQDIGDHLQQTLVTPGQGNHLLTELVGNSQHPPDSRPASQATCSAINVPTPLLPPET